MPTRILIVDDDPDIRRILRKVLRPVGRVLEAADGEEALRLLAREKPELMLLDVTMPGVDGLTVLARARAAVPSLIVLMLTGETDLHVARAALERGARAYITKPFDPTTLREEVLRLTSGAPDAAYDPPPWRVRP